jgi:hydrogenase maturation protease
MRAARSSTDACAEADITALLLIGYGNPGRGDDGLGPRFVEALAGEAVAGLTPIADYQLSAEHVLAVAEAERVVFADAMIGGSKPFMFEKIEARQDEGLGSHSLTPSAVLGLAAVLYGKTPDAFVMGITGYDFEEVKEGLTDAARANLDLAVAHFWNWFAPEAGRRGTSFS